MRVFVETRARFSILLLIMMMWVATTGFSQISWEWQNPLPQGNDLHAIHLFDAANGLAVGGGGVVVATTNGGLSWEVRPNAAGVSTTLRSVQFNSDGSGWVVGDSGTVLSSLDHGLSWK